MEIFTIKKSEEGKRLDQFLMEKKHWPRAFFMKALRTKKIKVNGRKEEAAFRLSAGDEVRSFVLEKRDAVRPSAFFTRMKIFLSSTSLPAS